MKLMAVLLGAAVFCLSTSAITAKGEINQVGSEGKWLFLATTEDRRTDVFISEEHVKREGEAAKGILRYRPSEERIKKMKDEFDRINEETKKEFGYLPPNTEKIFENMIEQNTSYHIVRAYCEKNIVEIEMGATFRMEVKPDSFAEKIKNILCTQQ